VECSEFKRHATVTSVCGLAKRGPQTEPAGAWRKVFVKTSLHGLKLSLCVILAWLPLSLRPAQAQVTTGSIVGAVQDPADAAVEGAKVVLSSPLLPGGSRFTASNSRGEYRFTGLHPGTYALRVESDGFRVYEETDLRVLTAGTTERNVTLQVGAVTETITVTGEAPVIDVHLTSIQNSISVERLEVTATERYGVQSYLTLLPGVTASDYGRVWQTTVMGSNTNETTLLSDGVSINNASSGGFFLTGEFDSAEEISATLLGASTEYQAAGGGVVQLISKSGTNQFHGDLSGYWSPDFLTTKPTKRPCDNCADGKDTGFKWYKYRDFSGHIGGPIVHDKAWFFGGMIYRGRFGRSPGQPDPPDDQRFLDWILDTNWKASWQINDQLQFQQTYYAEIWSTVNPPMTNPTRPIETLWRSYGNAKMDGNYGSQIVWTPTPKTVLTGRYNISLAGNDQIGFYEDLDTPIHRDLNTGVWSGNYVARQTRPRRDEGSVKVNTYKTFGSVSNNLSFGVQISRNKNVRVDIQPGGVVYQDLDGQPEQAQFVDPDVYGAVSRAQGFWAENEMTVGPFTFKYGARFDRMVGSSQDVPQFDNKFNEIGTTKGLGDLVTWNTFSPRGGVAVRLTKDNKTTLRLVAGRYYLPLFLSEFASLSPGRAVTRTMRYDPATGGYTILASVSDPRSQTQIDRDMKPPFTDQFAIDFEREVARGFSVGVNLVYKRSGNLLGYDVLNGVYGEQDVTLADGRVVTVYPLLSNSADRVFLRTNGDGLYSNYRAFILNVTKRFSDRWQLTAGYTRQRAKGVEVTGQDPNDYINADGGLGTRDRPHMFTMIGSYEVPRIGVQVSANMALVSGAAVSSTAQVRLPQGNRSIRLEPAGSKYRSAAEYTGFMRISKFLFRKDSRRLEVAAEFKNLFQEQDSSNIQSTVFNSANFLKTNELPEPLQVRLFARWSF
jgi:hypothetical protein